MAHKIKIPRKEIIQPDAFVTFSEKMALATSQHKGRLIAGIAGLILLAIGWAGFNYLQHANALKMEKLLFDMKQIQGRDGGAPELKAKYEELKAGSYRNRGALILADSQFQKGEFDAAMALYSEVEATANPEGLQYQLATLGMGYSHEAKKEYDKAIAAFKTLIGQSQGFPLFDVYAGMVRCYELKKDPGNALLILREMEGKFQDHSQLNWVERRIAKLSAAS
jgi:tetratricopeptide (TPR) repeat protein